MHLEVHHHVVVSEDEPDLSLQNSDYCRNIHLQTMQILYLGRPGKHFELPRSADRPQSLQQVLKLKWWDVDVGEWREKMFPLNEAWKLKQDQNAGCS